MRILIVAHYFPPLQSVGSLRPGTWARHWRAAGHDVHVLTTRKSAADGLLDASTALPFAGMVTEVSYARRIGDFLENRARGANGQAPERARPLAESRSLLRWLKRKVLANYLDFRQLWVRPAIEAGDALMRQQSFDALVSTTPPYPAHLVASALKARHPGVVWAADYRDLWSGSHLFPGIAPVRALERRQERKTLSRADLVSTVSEPLAAYLRDLLGREVSVLPNGFERDERPAHEPRAAGAAPVVVHTGTVYEGGHDVRTLLRALQILARRPSVVASGLRLRFYGESRVLATACNDYPDAARFIERMHSVPRREALAAQAKADGVLFFDWDDTSTASGQGVLSGKLFEYLSSGTEILVVGGADSAAGRLVISCDAGACFGADHVRLADALERIALQGGRRVDVRWDLLAPYERQQTSLALLESVIACVQARRGGPLE